MKTETQIQTITLTEFREKFPNDGMECEVLIDSRSVWDEAGIRDEDSMEGEELEISAGQIDEHLLSQGAVKVAVSGEEYLVTLTAFIPAIEAVKKAFSDDDEAPGKYIVQLAEILREQVNHLAEFGGHEASEQQNLEQAEKLLGAAHRMLKEAFDAFEARGGYYDVP